jgi:hypothetical protein
MTSIWRSLTTARSLVALGIGLMLFLALSIVRIRLQYAFHPAAPVGFLLTLLMYLIPGATVGLLAPQVRFLDGVILGLLTAVVVWFEVRMQRASLPWTDVARFAGFIVLFGVVVSVAGSLAAHWAVQRVTSNNRWRGP